MAEASKVIDKAIEQHHDIKNNLKLAGDSLTDIEAGFILNKAYSGWSQSSIRELEVKRDGLIRAVGALAEGLKRHFGFEEKSLPSLLADEDMKNIIRDHREIARQIENAGKILRETVLDGLSQRELLKTKSAIQEVIRNLMQTVEDHAKHEELILISFKRASEKTPVK